MSSPGLTDGAGPDHADSLGTSPASSEGTFVSAGVLSAASTSLDDYASVASMPIRSNSSSSLAQLSSPPPAPANDLLQDSWPPGSPTFSDLTRPSPNHDRPSTHTNGSPASPSSPLSPSELPTTATPQPSRASNSTHTTSDPADASAASTSIENLSQSLDQMTMSRQLSLTRRVSTSSSQEEETSWATWQAHKRHFFILNSAGKPVFSRYGDENALAGFMAIIQAIMSVVQDQGDTLRHIQAGRHLIVFLVRGPLYLVAASCAGEPVPALQRQLELLHNQIIFIVTSSLERVCQRNPGYDVRQLLGGTWGVLHALIRHFSMDPCYLLEAVQVLPVPPHERRPASEALADAVKASGAMYGIIAIENQIIALERSKNAPPLHPWDLLLLTNFVSSNESYRYRFGESFSPVCLPNFQPSAFLHAYIRYLAPEAGICLLLLSPSPESFHLLSDARGALEQRLEDEGILPALQQRLAVSGDGRPRLEFIPKHAGGGHVGHTPMWHFLLKLPARKQVICPAFRDPIAAKPTRKALVRAYARLHAAVWGPATASSALRTSPISIPSAAAAAMWGPASSKPHRVHWHVDSKWSLLAHVDRDAEVYAVFDPLVDKEHAARICDQLRRHILDKARLAELVLGV